MSSNLKQYLLVTGNYWAFTLTDGALRMLVLLYFYQLGYSPLAIAGLFLFYEVAGIVTNLLGGYLGARFGLNKTMNVGLGLQILALVMLLVPESMLSVVWVMAAQGLSGIAKDLNKMSAKSSVKQLVVSDGSDNSAAGQSDRLYKWVAALTGSKNALKGVGFFLGGALLSILGFQGAVAAMALALLLVLMSSLVFLGRDLGKAKNKPKFKQLLSKSAEINWLSGARLFLFGARDIWFVIAVPVYCVSVLGWAQSSVGAFMALWVIGYGFIQALAPKFVAGTGRSAFLWVTVLSVIPLLMAAGFWQLPGNLYEPLLIVGLMIFGAVFAINSAVHSFLIVDFAKASGTSLDVGFYYMANASGRLLGTVLSGSIYQLWGLEACLVGSGLMLMAASLLSRRLV